MTVGFGSAGRSGAAFDARLDGGRRLATRAGRGGGPIIRLAGRSLLDDGGFEAREKASSRLGGSRELGVSGRSNSNAVSGRPLSSCVTGVKFLDIWSRSKIWEVAEFGLANTSGGFSLPVKDVLTCRVPVAWPVYDDDGRANAAS